MTGYPGISFPILRRLDWLLENGLGTQIVRIEIYVHPTVAHDIVYSLAEWWSIGRGLQEKATKAFSQEECPAQLSLGQFNHQHYGDSAEFEIVLHPKSSHFFRGIQSSFGIFDSEGTELLNKSFREMIEELLAGDVELGLWDQVHHVHAVANYLRAVLELSTATEQQKQQWRQLVKDTEFRATITGCFFTVPGKGEVEIPVTMDDYYAAYSPASTRQGRDRFCEFATMTEAHGIVGDCGLSELREQRLAS